MDVIYKSKVSPVLFVPVIIIIAGISVVYAIDQIWVGLAINLLVGGFITQMFLTTRYTITGNSLNVRCGFFYNMDVDVSTIRLIVETNSVLSAPALSLDD
jgi:uncharacterized membrane protein YdbT with pleckstrin-like domain